MLWPTLHSRAWSPASEGGCQAPRPLTKAGWWRVSSESHSSENSKLALNIVLRLGREYLSPSRFRLIHICHLLCIGHEGDSEVRTLSFYLGGFTVLGEQYIGSL